MPRARDSEGFGRDQMNALVGGGISEALTRAPAAKRDDRKGRPSSSKEIADMSIQETAQFLESQKNRKKKDHKVAQSRHRSVHKREYQKLLAEQQLSAEDETAKDEEELNSRKMTASVEQNVKRRRYDSEDEDSDADQDDETSSSSSSSSSSAPRRKRSVGSSDDSEQDLADERRRKHLLRMRQKKQDTETTEPPEHVEAVAPHEVASSAIPPPKLASPKLLTRSHIETYCSSASSEESSDSSSSSSESSEEVPLPTKAKLVFVPKHKRSLVLQQDQLEYEEYVKAQKKEELQLRRKKESRAMVQQALEGTSTAPTEDFDAHIDGVPLSAGDPPRDDGEINLDAWEVRELKRLLDDIDAAAVREREEHELERRRKMTDEERMHEDLEKGEYRRPGGDRERPVAYRQRYFHKGAFFQDPSEYDESDVRHRAAEYAEEATGDDKIDKSRLTEIIRGENYGFSAARRYKGLQAEDTTDRSAKQVPHSQDKNRKLSR